MSENDIGEPATYQRCGLPQYDGNPFIEALPPIMSMVDAASNMRRYPEAPTQSVIALSPEVRRHDVGRLYGLLQPLPFHLEVQATFDEVLRGAYVPRNPLLPSIKRWVHRVERVDFSTTTGTLALTGASGMGKTKLAELICGLYPQVIQHTVYNGQPFEWIQIVYLIVECPPNGTFGGLYDAFFRAVDRVLGTDHYNSVKGATNSVKRGLMLQLCRTYWIGVLIIDELQHLNDAKAGGRREMLNFFDALTNDEGVATFKIGTYSAISMFADELRSARRANGDGLYDFKRALQTDKWWDLLVDTAWEYQWTQSRTEMTPEIRATLYDLTQGITAILIRLLVLAQKRAITLGKKKITSAFLKKIFNDYLTIVKPAVQALRRGGAKALKLFEDLLPTSDRIDAHIAAIDKASQNSTEDLLLELARMRDAAVAAEAKQSAARLPTLSPTEARIARLKGLSGDASLILSVDSESPVKDLRSRGYIPETCEEF